MNINTFNPFTQTNQRRISKTTTKFFQGAQWERYYGSDNTWVDIHDDFHEDVSKAGNVFTRCLRWDGEFRSYRNDRGLEIRKKEDGGDPASVGRSFVSGFSKAAATTLALRGLAFVPGPIGVAARTVGLVGSSKILGAAALGLTSYDIGRRVIKGEPLADSLANLAGGLAGGYLGASIGFGRTGKMPAIFSPIQAPRPKFTFVKGMRDIQSVGPFGRLDVAVVPAKGFGITTKEVIDVDFANLKLAKQNKRALASAKKIIRGVKLGKPITPSKGVTGQATRDSLRILSGKLRSKGILG